MHGRTLDEQQPPVSGVGEDVVGAEEQGLIPDPIRPRAAKVSVAKMASDDREATTRPLGYAWTLTESPSCAPVANSRPSGEAPAREGTVRVGVLLDR